MPSRPRYIRERTEIYTQQRACTRKRRFDSIEQTAKTVGFMRRGGYEGAHAYRCRYCGKWHVTRTGKR